MTVTGFAGVTLAVSRQRSPPPGLTDADYEVLTAEHKARGQRCFWAGWDHSLADYPTLLAIGVDGYLARARESLRAHREPVEQAALRGMIAAPEAFSAWMARWQG